MSKVKAPKAKSVKTPVATHALVAVSAPVAVATPARLTRMIHALPLAPTVVTDVVDVTPAPAPADYHAAADKGLSLPSGMVANARLKAAFDADVMHKAALGHVHPLFARLLGQDYGIKAGDACPTGRVAFLDLVIKMVYTTDKPVLSMTEAARFKAPALARMLHPVLLALAASGAKPYAVPDLPVWAVKKVATVKAKPAAPVTQSEGSTSDDSSKSTDDKQAPVVVPFAVELADFIKSGNAIVSAIKAGALNAEQLNAFRAFMASMPEVELSQALPATV